MLLAPISAAHVLPLLPPVAIIVPPFITILPVAFGLALPIPAPILS